MFEKSGEGKEERGVGTGGERTGKIGGKGRASPINIFINQPPIVSLHMLSEKSGQGREERGPEGSGVGEIGGGEEGREGEGATGEGVAPLTSLQISH